MTFNPIPPPINVRSEIAERRDAKKSRKYARDPDRKSLSQRLESNLGSTEGLETARSQEATYSFTVSNSATSLSFRVNVSNDNPSVVLPEDSPVPDTSDLSLDEIAVVKRDPNQAVVFEEYASNNPTSAEELSGKIRQLIRDLTEESDSQSSP